MATADQLQSFLELYSNHAVQVLKPTEKEIRVLFKTWTAKDFWGHRLGRLPTPSPIHWTWTRIKRPESVVDKMLGQPATFPNGLSMASLCSVMNDAVAGRIVVYFLSNLPQLHHTIVNERNLEISKRNPPVAFLSEQLTARLGLTDVKRVTKESGYASIHYIVRFKDSSVPPDQRPWFEIQVRTLAEHVWGEIEHLLGYKPGKQTSFGVRRQFQILSAQLGAIDEHFNLLLDELERYQEEVQVTPESTLNAENLPGVLASLGIGCAQKEIDILLSILSSRGINRVSALKNVGTPAHLDMVRNTYRKFRSRAPDNFEIVASLAAIRGIDTEADIVRAIEVQIKFLETWVQLKGSGRQP